MTVYNAITYQSVGIVNDSNFSKKLINKSRGKRLTIKKDTILSKPKKRNTQNLINIFVTRIKKCAVKVIVS